MNSLEISLLRPGILHVHHDEWCCYDTVLQLSRISSTAISGTDIMVMS
jgi:hypothetical protein